MFSNQKWPRQKESSIGPSKVLEVLGAVYVNEFEKHVWGCILSTTYDDEVWTIAYHASQVYAKVNFSSQSNA